MGAQLHGPHIRHNRAADDFYGYLWWMDNWLGFFIAEARGKGGQYIWISRELDLVAVTTSELQNDQGGMGRLINDWVLPSVFRTAPAVEPDGIVNAASGRPSAVAPDSFVSIYGENLAPAQVRWDSVILDGKTLPKTLGGVSVRMAGRDCYLSYAGPAQLNVLTPPDLPAGPTDVEVAHPGGTARASVTVAPVSPALFTYTTADKRYAAAVFAGERVHVGQAGTLEGVTSRPARPHDHIELYATGLGGTARPHPAGEVLAEAYPIADPRSVRVFFGDLEAHVEAVNMTYAGLWQVNIEVPENVPPGEVRVTLLAGGETSPAVWMCTGS